MLEYIESTFQEHTIRYSKRNLVFHYDTKTLEQFRTCLAVNTVDEYVYIYVFFLNNTVISNQKNI